MDLPEPESPVTMMSWAERRTEEDITVLFLKQTTERYCLMDNAFGQSLQKKKFNRDSGLRCFAVWLILCFFFRVRRPLLRHEVTDDLTDGYRVGFVQKLFLDVEIL